MGAPGLLLDSITGRPVGAPPNLADVPGRGVLYSYMNPDVDVEAELHRAPPHVQANLDKAASSDSAFHPRMSMQGWEETLYAPLSDGAAAAGAAEATMFPIFTLPANYLYPGRLMKWTVMGRISTVITTPGVVTHKLAYSATGLGAVVVATSGGFIPDVTAGGVNETFMEEWWMVCRSSGTSGTGFGWGRIEMPDVNDVDLANFVLEYRKRLAPQATPAVATIDTTVARALNPTHTQTAATGSMTAHVGFLEAVT